MATNDSGWMFCVRPIPGWDGYFADITGGVWSTKVQGSATKRQNVPLKKKPQKNIHGRLFVQKWEKGKPKSSQVHRLIYAAFNGKIPKGIEIDHANRNVLDNRLENLRTATSSQNKMNKSSQKRSTSKYLGVHFDKGTSKWRARISPPGKADIHLGLFENEEDAAKAYDAAAVKFFGEFANPNFDR